MSGYGAGIYGVDTYGDAPPDITATWQTTIYPQSYATRVTLWSCDRYGNRLAEIPVSVPIEGTLAHNDDAAIHRTLTLSVNDPAWFTPYRDFVMPELRFIYPDGSQQVRRGEVFLVTGLTENTTSGRTSGAVVAEDLTTLLARSNPGAMTIPAGTDTGSAARDLALGGGFSPHQVSIPDTGIDLTSDLVIDPGVSRLKAMTDLLNAGAWYAPWMNRHGVITSRPWTALEDVPTARIYGVGEGVELVPPIVRDPEWGSVANSVTVRNVAPDRDPIWATARITNPAHPLFFDPNDSSRGIGYELAQDPIDDPNVPDAATALERATAILSERASLLSRLRVRSILDIEADTHDVLQVDGEGRVAPYNGRWWRRAWTIRLRGATATIDSDLRHVEQI